MELHMIKHSYYVMRNGMPPRTQISCLTVSEAVIESYSYMGDSV